MTVPAEARIPLPGDPYELWVRGDLLEAMGIHEDGRTRVEIIGGEIVVSPGPTLRHARILGLLAEAFDQRQVTQPGYPWTSAQGADFNLERIAAGYVPDLVALDEDTFDEVAEADARYLTASQIELVIEVTSRWNAEDDRMPGPRRTRPTKWSGYASVGLPFYLLVDRDPAKPKITLYSDLDVRAAAYQESRTWKFGEVVALPEPFDLEIPTIKWKTWADDEF